MYTLLLPGRSVIITDDARDHLVRAIEAARPIETIPIELNGNGSGAWEVTINLAQVIAFLRHPTPPPNTLQFQDTRAH